MGYKRVYTYLIYFIILKLSFSNAYHLEGGEEYKGRFPEVGVLPHIVHISTASKSFHCTGAIINESWVITAAHCLYDRQNRMINDQVDIVAGVNEYMSLNKESRQERQAEEVIIHPKFWLQVLSKYDMALIKLKNPFIFNTNITSIEIEGEKWPNKDGRNTRKCIAGGFGVISMDEEDAQKNTKLKMLDVEAGHGENSCPCTKRFQWKRLVCIPSAADPILCNGDSGGVLVCNKKAVAIAHMTIDSRTCDNMRYPTKFKLCGRVDVLSIFLFLCPFNDWIHSYVSNVPPTPVSCIHSYIESLPKSEFKFTGKFASVGELQHVVYIQINKFTICSGAIINESWILSAAHCFYDNDDVVSPQDVEIVAGINDYLMLTAQEKQESVAKEIIIHPEFWMKRLSKYDIALIQLEKPFQLDLSVFYIEIDGDEWPKHDGTEPRSCTASGFGLIESNVTKNTKLKLMEVNAFHGQLACPCTKRYQWKRLVCLTSSSQPVLCPGDSGSVLVCNNKAVAVAHMSIEKKLCSVKSLIEFTKCGHENIIPIYMFLCPLNDWIRTYVPNVPPTPLSCEALKLQCCILSFLVCVFITVVM